MTSCGDPPVGPGVKECNPSGFPDAPNVTYECDSDYQLLDGVDTITCKDGIWTTPIPQCLRMYVYLLNAGGHYDHLNLSNNMFQGKVLLMLQVYRLVIDIVFKKYSSIIISYKNIHRLVQM